MLFLYHCAIICDFVLFFLFVAFVAHPHPYHHSPCTRFQLPYLHSSVSFTHSSVSSHEIPTLSPGGRPRSSSRCVFLLLSSILIPISLKITLDVAKLLYALWIDWDLQLLDEQEMGASENQQPRIHHVFCLPYLLSFPFPSLPPLSHNLIIFPFPLLLSLLLFVFSLPRFAFSFVVASEFIRSCIKYINF